MSNIYKDIAERTNGNIYIGVVGPVRTGKSTFVTQFMQKLVLPNITDKNEKKRAIDQLPQSADGKNIMTTQPKFVPDNGVAITLEDKTTANVRLIDCVGYLIEGAEGHVENDKPRLVTTPWSAEPMPFDKAAELGTQKVATEHSTIAVVVTTDGSIGEIPRKNYVQAEERVINELKQANKPFVVVVNTKTPADERTEGMCKTLQEKYQVAVIAIDLANCKTSHLQNVLQAILGEFALRRISVDLPSWMRTLERDDKIVLSIMERLKECTQDLVKMKDCKKLEQAFTCEYIEGCQIESLDSAKGVVACKLTPKNELFFQILSEQAGFEISNEFSLMNFVKSSAYAKSCFETMKDAISQADELGYGIVMPQMDKMTLDEPQMVKQGGIYGVKLKARAPSYHIIKVDVTTDVSPMVGTEQQSQYLLDEYRRDPQLIWNTNMFGKTMSGIATEGLMSKCYNMPMEIKQKLHRTVGRIVNENKGGLICFLL